MISAFRSNFFRRLGVAVGCLWVAVVASELRAAVTIQTSDGRELRGEIDARTTAQHLWIRQEKDRISLVTEVPWPSVKGAAIDGKSLEVSELARSWPQLASWGSATSLAEAMKRDAGSDKSFPSSGRVVQRVASIEVGAQLVNLDRDVEPDGLELTIVALNQRGEPVPVRGNLTARLVGERDEKHFGTVRFEELQRWSQVVEFDDFGDGLASYALRFRLVRPEFDWELIPYALLNVRLGVSGEGNFEASVPVVIRQFNPFRDQLQKYARSRFFRDELTDEVRRRGVARPGSGLQAWSRR